MWNGGGDKEVQVYGNVICALLVWYLLSTYAPHNTIIIDISIAGYSRELHTNDINYAICVVRRNNNNYQLGRY